jgi:hypothetical protein
MVVFITRHRRLMARSLDQIHKDLKKLAADTAALDKKLRGLYGQYFPVLGAAVRQQLVLAAYHLCTQAYPEAFLALSKAEREKLQESLRKLGRQGQTHIEELVNLDNVSATLSLLLNSKEKRLRAAMVSGERSATIATPAEPRAAGGTAPEAPAAPTNPEADGSGDEGFSGKATDSERPEPPSAFPASDVAEGDAPAADRSPSLSSESDAGVLDTSVLDLFSSVSTGTETEASRDDETAPSDPSPLENSPELQDEAGGVTTPSSGDTQETDDGDAEGEGEAFRALPPKAMAAIAEALSSNHPAPSSDPSPLHLAKRHVLMERQIRATLHTLSNMGNYLLKRVKILPDLPDAVLSAAAESESGEGTPAVPNLLNVLVEVGQRLEGVEGEGKDEEELSPEMTDPLEEDADAPERAMTHLMALNLRLGDIEFTDTQTALRRSKIQETLARLKQLSRRYQKLQQEKARAEAEAMWRSTWFEESAE